jgi:predicted nucleic acid-binding protein
MLNAISNTSPLLYLYRIDALKWLPGLFAEIWIPGAVVFELQEGRQKGYDVPNPSDYNWIKIIEPKMIPSEWFAVDLGAGELAAMSLAIEYPENIILLDDALARRTAKAAGLNVWGTLRILLEGKSHGLIENVKPQLNLLEDAGMWVSEGIRQRLLALAGEK